ncbi:MAG: L-rhamnose/proton symporter RhaT [Verrucomicrobia bacterium]|nr:L-rhamnose/proton symporter RhaT [Verrucomicrobiota bacterium]
MANPFLGVALHWLGGLAAGSFYVPYKGVKKWSWETYWLVGGFFSWIICPWLFASFMTNDLFGVLRQQSTDTLAWSYFFGVLWGIGGLTFGLAVRYLGLSLGVGVALGFCAALGTLLPATLKIFMPGLKAVEASVVEIAKTAPGQVTLGGIAVCLIGIGISALAGLTKEKEMSAADKQKSVAEFSFGKGLLVATFAGVMSACMSFGLTAAKPLEAATVAAGTGDIWKGLPGLVVVLLGGFTTNFIWCVFLNIKNRSGYQYLASHVRAEHAGLQATGGDHGGGTTVSAAPQPNLKVPRFNNYIFAALAGAIWYFQFFFYTMGSTKMGDYHFASWTLHMASIIIFSTAWGWYFREWKGSSKKAHTQIALGIALLVTSTLVIGYGTLLKGGGTLQSFWNMMFGN